MRLRSYPSVLRIHDSRKKDKDHEKFYSELLLFSHWENEELDLPADDEEICQAKYIEKKFEIQENRKKIYPGESTVDLLDSAELELVRPVHLADTLDCQGEQENDEDLEVGPIEDPAFESFGYTGNLNLESPPQFENCKYKRVEVPDANELNHFTRRLVPEQMNVLRKVIESCKDVVKARNVPTLKPRQSLILVHGGAGKINLLIFAVLLSEFIICMYVLGVGKSATIKAVAQQAEKILWKEGDHPNHPRVLLCAWTGKASHLIGKSHKSHELCIFELTFNLNTIFCF